MQEQFTTMTFSGLTGTNVTWDETGAVSKEPKGMVIQNGAYVGMGLIPFPADPQSVKTTLAGAAYRDISRPGCLPSLQRGSGKGLPRTDLFRSALPRVPWDLCNT